MQRKCACGGKSAEPEQKCKRCASKKMQKKLSIGAAADPLEHEADRVADEVLRKPISATTSSAPVGVQRAVANDSTAVDTVPASVEQVLSSPGDAMSGGVREDMERRFGHDFSNVRIHTDAAAAESAREVNARAYTIGNHIAFRPGAFDAASGDGRRLLAHELTHVVQQRSAAAPRMQRQPAAPELEKSGAVVEQTYRAGARNLQDPTLAAAANDVRNCRELGGPYCEMLVTDADIHRMYGQWTLIEDVKGREVANRAIRDHKLPEVAQQVAIEKAKADQEKQSQAPTGGVMMGGLAVAPLAPLAPATTTFQVGAGTAANLNTARVAVQSSSLISSATAANSNVAALAPKPVPVAAVGPAIVIVFGIVVTVQLVGMASFQSKLWAAGYRFLPSPRGVCMRGCHQSKPQLPDPEFPDLEPFAPTRIDPTPTLLGPRGGQRTWDLTDVFPHTDVSPDPKRRDKDRRDRKCKFDGTARPRGGNPEHDALAHQVTGSPEEMKVTTPEGESKQFDGEDFTGTLYDVKTRHDFLRLLNTTTMPLTPGQVWGLANGVAKLREEVQYEQKVASRCHRRFHIATNNFPVVVLMRDVLGDIMDRDRIEFESMPWP
ncbi:MAG TPA: DUF4157 domain-containing protein [Steroidobacteraceae bacterium]|nr:DUF4157 domain-containing protein [Steroidobacteraceae bacterium]